MHQINTQINQQLKHSKIKNKTSKRIVWQVQEVASNGYIAIFLMISMLFIGLCKCCII